MKSLSDIRGETGRVSPGLVAATSRLASSPALARAPATTQRKPTV